MAVFLRVLLFAMAWDYLFYDFNFYYNQWHIYDRIFLGLLVAFSLQYPLFLIPTLLQINLLQHQFDFPIGKLSFLDKNFPYELLAVSCSFMVLVILRRIANRNSIRIPDAPDDLLLLVLMVVAGASYYHSGLAKVAISPFGWDWALDNQISNNITAMRNRGWLESVKGLQHLAYTFFRDMQVPAQLVVLAGELVFIALLFSRRVAGWMLLIMLVLHLGVFFLNGALFWGWMIADAGLILLLKKNTVRFNWKTGLAGVFFIHFSVLLIKVPALGWYDSPIDNRFELVTNGGQALSEASLSPYTRHFQHGAFLDVVDGKTLSAGFLVYDHAQMLRMNESDRYSIYRIIVTEGKNRYNPETKRSMEIFLTRFLENTKPNPFRGLQPPAYWNAHLFSTKKVIPASEIDSLILYNQIEWNRENRTEVIRSLEVLKVNSE